jgi:gas vesicle protein
MPDDVRDEIENTEEDEVYGRFAWFLTGAIIGATIAILYAPKSGKDTRKYISDVTQSGRDAVADTGKDIVDAGKEMFERGRRLVEDAADLFDRGKKLVKG